MTKLNQELNQKTNEELAILVFRLKLQLLEFRFKKQTGEFDKKHLVSEIKRTIAKALTILNLRKIKVRIGTHGLTIYDLANNNKPTSLNKQANEVMSETSKAFEAGDEQNKPGKETVKNNVDDIIKVEDSVLKSMPVKNDIKSGRMDSKRKAGPIRKAQGGGQ
ncbi:MAG: 50S ribosomal protein L29 [Methanobrevibacter sp.]|jgi:large subunit ribosomal protein L29|nr:50S ribosomal protein L29 [Methanobrevibacter sp.]